ncbi:hypothetical protein NESM_000681900 [Novymonas esmeraldas]|uniref:Uncharacterized protein n=1 Tax=Novymonas esmeraldas TaxID=1808958 RepID=A0AAW0EV14_9TRYP
MWRLGTAGVSDGAVLCVARRWKSYSFFVNLDDPEATRRRVEERLDCLISEEKKGSTAYLHALLNLSLSHYQRGDFISARDMANYTHQKALAHNPASSLLYFTATTCARCAEALASQYEAHVRAKEEQCRTSAALAPAPSVLFAATRTITKLRADAERYRVIAHRVYNRPDMAFMRCGGSDDGRWRASARHDDTDSSSGYSRGRDRRCAWEDESSSNNVDEEAAPHVYGDRWQERRKRPEHVELKHYYKRQCGPTPKSRRGTLWNVPK